MIDKLTWTSWLVYLEDSVTIIRAIDAPQFELPGVQFTALAAPSRGSAQICTWRINVAPGLTSPESHTIDQDEIFMVTAGAIRVTPGGDLLSAGDAVVVPAGSPILLVNPNDEPAEAYIAIRAGFTAAMADGTAIGTPPWAQ
jgi:quercetin dioxygenase-like cupin family protein